MGRLGAWYRQWRAVRRARFDPRAAPHRGLVHAHLRANLRPLDTRARPNAVDELCDRLLVLEPTPDELYERSAPWQLHVLVLRARQAVERLVADELHAARRFAHLTDLHGQIASDEERRRLLEEYLADTATSRRQFRGDVQALRRHLDLEALRERNARGRHHLAVTTELALEFLGRATERAVTAGDDDRPDITAFLGDAGVDEVLVDRAASGKRWHERRAALDSLARIYRHAAEAGATLTDGPRALRVASELAGAHDEEPWVRGAALALALIIDRAEGAALLDARLVRGPDDDARAFLTRALAVRHALGSLGDAGVARVRAAIDDGEASEHVLCTACRFAPATAAGLGLLRRLAGLEGEPPPARVRGSAAAAIGALCRGDDDALAGDAASALADLLELDDTPLILRVGAGELARTAEAHGRAGRDPLLARVAPRWQEVLGALAERANLAGAITEAAAAASEAIERERSGAHRALARTLEAAVAALEPGGSTRLALSALPAPARPLARDPGQLGRILAALSRDDWGLGARVLGDRLTLWRGERSRWHLWRVLHEVRHPAPNKRQGHRHSIGRVPRGLLRAPPGRLDEATSTTVPGERVYSDREGAWGRHLPMVDDLLHLPVTRGEPVRIFSSHGVTTVTPPASLVRRLLNRARITVAYRQLATLRNASLDAAEHSERSEFLTRVRESTGIEVAFTPWPTGARPDGATPPAVASLFAPESSAPRPLPAVAAAGGPIADVQDWFSTNSYYFLSATENSQSALTLFVGGLLGVAVGGAFLRRRTINRLRGRIPLSIGGWGTRGKSGTERIKAGMFHGLGFDVFSKTTGCEAMFIHAVGEARAEEIFLYRPYDKASIWEQAAMVKLAARMGTEVFLWECMALNPRYVSVLQDGWMRDNIATITNAYPDHEDIQGPAGIDVARVIARFVPRRSTLLTSEVSFLPLFADVCRARDTALIPVPLVDADLLAGDLLELFPYREHPHNIALVARMAEELGVDRDLAIVLMADHVVADLGVLKSYPTACVRGRKLTFVNAMSANERTGFVASWRRMGLADYDVVSHPHDRVLIVINNRADRIPRSEVFARILARDIDADRFVMIGTNLKGLRGYLDTALGELLEERPILTAQDLAAAGDAPLRLPRERLARYMARLRVPPAEPGALVARLERYLAAAGARVDEHALAALGERAGTILASAGSVDVADVRRALASDKALGAAIAGCATADAGEPPGDVIETLEPPSRTDAAAGFLGDLARATVRARLLRSLEAELARGREADPAAFDRVFRPAYRALFAAALIEVEDPSATGDQIVDTLARSLPPGTDVSVVGVQNIKGTGLDFAYRWIAVDAVTRMCADLDHARPDRRIAALEQLASFTDWGFMDAGLARARLAASQAGATLEEERLVKSLREQLELLCAGKRAALGQTARTSAADVALGWIESNIDYLDAIRRKRASRGILDDLVAGRISHGNAALEMRRIVSRQKGGWLAKAIKRLR